MQGKEEILSNIDHTVILIEQVFRRLPAAYKRDAIFPDFWMVLGGLKSATDLAFAGNTYDEKDFEQLRKAFESAELRVSELTVRVIKNGEPFRQGLVYSPRTLQRETADSNLVSPYDIRQSLEEWIQEQKTHNVQDGAIYGTLYSFPPSAIRDYMSVKDFTTLDRSRSAVSTGNETYWFFEPVQEDVKLREKLKEEFFSQLDQRPQIQRLLHSQDLQQSHNLWRERLPDFLQREKKSENVQINNVFKRIRTHFRK